MYSQPKTSQYNSQNSYANRPYNDSQDGFDDTSKEQMSPTIKLSRQRLITDVYGSAGIKFGQAQTTEANDSWKPSRRGATEPSKRSV